MRRSVNGKEYEIDFEVEPSGNVWLLAWLVGDDRKTVEPWRLYSVDTDGRLWAYLEAPFPLVRCRRYAYAYDLV